MSTVVLGGVTLNADMVWRERYQTLSVAQSVRYLLGGAPVVFAGMLQKGENMTLATIERMGYPTRAQIDQVIALAAVPGAIYTLTFHGVDYSVIFRHHDAPAVDMAPVKRTNRPSAGDWMRGEIRLMTV